jgi:probable phosphoglycerate mutase
VRLVLLRHGITEWNLEKRIQGRIDQPLGDAGRRQLASLAVPDDYLGDHWYCSPLRRAVESAELLGLGDVCVEPALIEMDWGDWEGEILKPLRKRIGEPMRENERRGLDFRPPGGESPRLVQARLQPWLRRIADRGDNSGAVVHNGIIRCIFALACRWDMCGETPVDFAWDALHQFELEPDGTLLNRYQTVPLLKKT